MTKRKEAMPGDDLASARSWKYAIPVGLLILLGMVVLLRQRDDNPPEISPESVAPEILADSIRTNSPSTEVLHSVNDPFFSLSKAEISVEQGRLASAAEQMSAEDAKAEISVVDGETAYLRQLFYHNCARAPQSIVASNQSSSALLDSIDRIDAEYVSPEFAETVLSVVEKQENLLEKCDSLSASQAQAEQFDWLEKSLERHYPLAVLNYVALGRMHLLELAIRDSAYLERYKTNAAQALRLGIRSGHSSGFLNVARASMDGDLIDQDFALILAYAHAAQLASRAQIDDPVAGLSTLFAENPERLMEIAESQLDLPERQEARAQGRDLCDEYCQ